MTRRCNKSHRPPRPAERLALEARARKRLEDLRGNPFSEEEWAIARKNIIDLFLVLRDWRKA
jgi:hypothetical protein